MEFQHRFHPRNLKQGKLYLPIPKALQPWNPRKISKTKFKKQDCHDC